MDDLAISSQMLTKEGFLLHLIRIFLPVVLLAVISSDRIGPLLNETFCTMYYLYF